MISGDAGISILSNCSVVVRVIIKITFHEGDSYQYFVVLANQAHNNVLILVE